MRSARVFGFRPYLLCPNAATVLPEAAPAARSPRSSASPTPAVRAVRACVSVRGRVGRRGSSKRPAAGAARGAGGAEAAVAMAEASPQQPGRYFCHCCSVEIVPRLPVRSGREGGGTVRARLARGETGTRRGASGVAGRSENPGRRRVTGRTRWDWKRAPLWGRLPSAWPGRGGAQRGLVRRPGPRRCAPSSCDSDDGP